MNLTHEVTDMRHDDTPIRRYSRPPNRWLMPALLAGSGGVLFLVLAIFTIMVVTHRGSDAASGGRGIAIPAAFGGRPSASSEGTSWTARRVAEHLSSSGAITTWEEVKIEPTIFATESGVESKVIFKTPAGRNGTIRQYSGPLACERAARTVTAPPHPSRLMVMAWGRLLIQSEHQADSLVPDIGPHLPGVILWDVSGRGVPYEDSPYKR